MSDTTEDPEFLTVRELAGLLRIKERKVYDLAASGRVPVSRATGRLLFPAREIRDWIQGAGSGGAEPLRPPIVLGSHDPLLDWAIRESGSGLATFFDGSADGLDRFVRGEGVAAGLHLRDAATGAWNRPRVAELCAGRPAVLLSFARRRRGLVLRPGGRRAAGIGDLAAFRIAPRQAGSGTAALFAALLAEAGLDPAGLDYAATARTETEAAEAVARGDADATLGLEGPARAFGLDFVPLLEERYDLLVDRRAWFEPGLQALAAFCRGAAFADRAAGLGGYDVDAVWEVVWNG